MSTRVWTDTADFTVDSAVKILNSDGLSLRQYLAVPDTCDVLDETSAWVKTQTNGGTVAASGGKWAWHAGTAAVSASLANLVGETFFTVSGNFDIQVDFSDLADNVSGTAYRYFATLRLLADANNYCHVYRAGNGVSNWYTGAVIVAGVTKFSTNVDTTATSGKFRMVRTNTDDIECFYWNGSAWVSIGSTLTGFSGAVYLRLSEQNTAPNTGTFDINTDNLTVNVGTIVNGYFKDSPTAACSELDTGGASGVVDMSSLTWTAGGTGSVEGRYAYGNSSGPTNWSTWKTLAQLQAESDPTCRYFDLQVRLVSTGTQTATVDAVSVNYTAITFVPYPFSRGARGGLLALSGGLAT